RWWGGVREARALWIWIAPKRTTWKFLTTPLTPPLDRTSHACGLLERATAGLCHLRHRLEELTPRPGHQARAGNIEAATVLQLVVGIESEEIGSALRAISARDLLRLVDHVGEGETVLLRQPLHVLEGILGIGFSVVGHDRDRADADAFERIRFRHEAADHRPHIRAMIADKGDEGALRPAHVGKRIDLAVDAFELEVRRL